jgi:hypothetical protein
MKKLVPLVVMISVFVFACSIPTTVITPTDTPVEITVTPPGPVANVTCNELSFYLDPALASGYTCTTVPEQTGYLGAHPQYTEVTLTGYVLADRFQSPVVDVFLVHGYDAISPGGIGSFVSDLQALVAGGTPGDTLPYLNPYEAAQLFYAQYQVLRVPSGSGIRYLTERVQNLYPISNHEMFYTYQGVTSDGIYAITAMLPDSNPILPENGDTIPGGQTLQQFYDNFDAYIADIKVGLDSQPPEAFTPSLAVLDALVDSITIQP